MLNIGNTLEVGFQPERLRPHDKWSWADTLPLGEIIYLLVCNIYRELQENSEAHFEIGYSADGDQINIRFNRV